MKKDPELPFQPKSTAYLKRGMIWDIELRDGSYACGRVLDLMPKGWPSSRICFWGGLLRWHGSHPPDTDSIFGAPVLWPGHFNVRSLAGTKSHMLGILPLEDDGLVIPPILTATINGKVTFGYGKNRTPTNEEFRTLPVMTVEVWQDSFQQIAEEYFLEGNSIRIERKKHQNRFLDSIGMRNLSDVAEAEKKIGKQWISSQKQKVSRKKQ